MDSSATSTPTPNPSQTPASANQQNTSTTSTGPQIRSRITVVCAECKRLKLKCDRKSPCGSCTKRDTVARCVYSPAAAEKVDLHSLNNRLIQVEAVLSMITAGHTPPAFQPAYPLSSSPSSTALPSLPALPASGRHQHHHHYAAPPSHCSANDSIMLSNHDITTIWLNDLDLGVSTPNTPCTTSMQHNSFTSGNSAGCIKLEPCNGDINLSLSNNDADTGTVFINIDGAQASSRSTLASRPVTPQSNGHSRSSQLADLYLPPLTIYYPASLETSTGTSSFTNQPNGVPSAVPLNGPPTHPHPTKPQLTSELLALLPPLHTCRFLLQRAGDVFRVRPVPFESGAQKGWKEFEERLRKEKAREAKRARQIYFGGINGLQSLSEDAEMDESTASGQPNGKEPFDERRSLPFFASLSATLAVGAFVSSQSGSDTGSASSSNPAFLLALSQQALGVWDTHTTSFGSAHSVAYDTERLQYLLACFTGMQYLFLSWSRADKAEKTTISSQIQALVSRMVNLARGIGLGRESASSQKSKPTQSPSEVQESADGLSNTTNLNRGASRKEKEAAKERARAEWKKKLLWEVMFYDLFTSDILEHQAYVPPYSYMTNTPICPDTLAQHSGNSTTASSEVVNGSWLMPTGDEDAYICSRYGLTKLAHAIKHQVNQPNCCCGYTYDQAAALEDRIRRWQSGLPVSLQTPLNASGITRSPSLHVQSCELAVMACLLIIKIYTPFLRINTSPAVSASPSASPPSQSGSANASPGNPSAPNSANGSPISLAIHAAASAAQTIIRAVKVYRSLSGSNSVAPAIFDMYALDKIVFDSVIICTHAGMTNIASSLSFDGGAIMTDVASGIEMLWDMASLDDRHKNMLDALSKRITNANGSPNMLKRKHSYLGNSTQVSNSKLFYDCVHFT
ncbi:hypothetical protein CPC08DRAFT_292792 [Agrocybe pediades]|nr:hypothetical protein CPC08DRAFT_292792 [Agrocybe pediades]